MDIIEFMNIQFIFNFEIGSAENLHTMCASKRVRITSDQLFLYRRIDDR